MSAATNVMLVACLCAVACSQTTSPASVVLPGQEIIRGKQDGSRVMVSNQDHVAFGTEIAEVRHHAGIVQMAWSPDGKRLAATSTVNRRIVLWDVEHDRLIREQEKESSSPGTIGFSSDGRVLISTALVFDRSDDHPTSFTLLDGHSGEVLETLPAPDVGRRFWPLFDVAADPTGHFAAMLFSTGPLVLALYDEQSWQPKQIVVPPLPSKDARASPTTYSHGIYQHEMRVSPDGRLIALIGQVWERPIRGSQVIDIYDTTSNQRVKQILMGTFDHPTQMEALAFSPDGSKIAYSNGSRSATVRTIVNKP
jgi:WD40 repeat protein